jgi:hypothetical protein
MTAVHEHPRRPVLKLAFRAEQVRGAQRRDACGARKGGLLAGARGAARGGAPRRSPSQMARINEHVEADRVSALAARGSRERPSTRLAPHGVTAFGATGEVRCRCFGRAGPVERERRVGGRSTAPPRRKRWPGAARAVRTSGPEHATSVGSLLAEGGSSRGLRIRAHADARYAARGPGRGDEHGARRRAREPCFLVKAAVSSARKRGLLLILRLKASL